MTLRFRYETAECSRCSGTGAYSFNYRDGSRCYGCSGTGRSLTRAGRTARETLADARPTVALSEIRPGDRVLIRDTGWGEVIEAGPDPLNEGRWQVSVTPDNGWPTNFGAGPEYTLRRAMTDEEREAFIKLAESLDGVTLVTS